MESISERKIIPAPFEIYEDELQKVLGYFVFMRKVTTRGEKVPPRVMKKFLDSFKFAGNYEPQLIRIKANDLTDSLFPFFEKSNYNFSVKVKKLPRAWVGKTPPRKIVEYNLKGLLIVVSNQVFDKKNNAILKDRDKCLQFVYSAIKKYVDDDLEGRIKLSEYRKTVIAARFASKLNFGLTSKKNPSNHDLFQVAHHVINKLKKEQLSIST